MKLVDAMLALISGAVFGYLVRDFLKGFGVQQGIAWFFILWIFFPLLSLVCLWVAYLIGKKFPFVFQAAKFLLVGMVATVIDLKVFELAAWIFALFLIFNTVISKIISFVVATLCKFWGNKHWVFQKHVSSNTKQEVLIFFVVTLIGLIIDVAVFYYFTKIAGAQFGVPAATWTKCSVIFAALGAAVSNFLGYKFLVFKK